MKRLIVCGLVLAAVPASLVEAEPVIRFSLLQAPGSDDELISPSDLQLKKNVLPEPAKKPMDEPMPAPMETPEAPSTPRNTPPEAPQLPANSTPPVLEPQSASDAPVNEPIGHAEPTPASPYSSSMPIASPATNHVDAGNATYQPASHGLDHYAATGAAVSYDGGNGGCCGDSARFYGNSHGYGCGHGHCGCNLPAVHACNAVGGFGMKCLSFGDRCLSHLRPKLMAPMSCGGHCHQPCCAPTCAPACPPACAPSCGCGLCAPKRHGLPFGLGGLFGGGLFGGGHGCAPACECQPSCDSCSADFGAPASCECNGGCGH